jgi:lysine 2,3-aminomutase
MHVQDLQQKFGLSDDAATILQYASDHPSTEITGFKNPLEEIEPLFDSSEAPEWLIDLFGAERLETLLDKKQQAPAFLKDLTQRMPSRITEWYQKLVKNSDALKRLILADPQEIADLSGTVDPSAQTTFMPLGANNGITHKYADTVHVMIILACAAYCRYCYQADFFSGKSGKKPAKPATLQEYLKTYLSSDAHQTQPITNVLLTGGDALQASNFLLALFIVILAECGISHIRFGSKVPVFQPMRGDKNFFGLLDKVHEIYPNLVFTIVTHISHPDEVLRKDKSGAYIPIVQNGVTTPYFKWHKPTSVFFANCARRCYINVANQFPQIRDINNNANVLALLLREGYKHGIHVHNIYQCRQIRGHKHFEIPIVEAYRNVMQANIQLNGLEAKGRLILSTEYGKMMVTEIVEPCTAFPEGLMALRRIRLPKKSSSSDNGGGIFLAKYNPDAVWIDDLLEGVLLDSVTNM